MAHKLNFYSKPSGLCKINYNMSDNTEFVITSSALNFHSELQNCIIALRPPYTVAKIHAFRTQARNVDLAQKQEKQRVEYLEGLIQRNMNAIGARENGMSVKDYITDMMGMNYDEEKDEFRLVAKVPGLNIYLEVLGVLDDEDTGMERWWREHPEDRPTDRAIDDEIGRQLGRMCYFMRTAQEKRDRAQYATMESDWQPKPDWVEEYDAEEYFKRPEAKGIGFTHTDPTRRPVYHERHTMTAEEQAELARLRQEAEERGMDIDAAFVRRLKHQAVANVAARKMME